MVKNLSSLAFLSVLLCTAQPAWADDLGPTCDNAAQGSQQATYCASAKDAANAAGASDTVWKMYAGVSAICTTMCGLSFTPAAVAANYNYLCVGGSVAAGVTDGVLTKNFMNAATSIGGAALGIAYQKGLLFGGDKAADAGTTAAQAQKVALDENQHAGHSSCITAMTTAFSSMQSYQSEQQSKQSEEQNLQSAEQVAAETGTVTASFNPGSPGSVTNTAPTLVSTAAKLGSPVVAAPASAGASSCGGADTVAGAAACAATAAPSLVSALSNPNFGNDFQKLTGTSFGDFMNGAGKLGPKGAMLAGMGGMADPGSLTKMNAALTAMQESMMPALDESGGMYASAGGGGGGSDDPDLSSIMGGLMKQLGPKHKEKTTPAVSISRFNNPRRALASTAAEDPTVSLFERVTLRYASVARRLIAERGSLKEWPAPASGGNQVMLKDWSAPKAPDVNRD